MIFYFSQSFTHQASNHTKIYKSNIYVLINENKSCLQWKHSTEKFEEKEEADFKHEK